MRPSYDFDKIKFACDGATFKRALKLYSEGKVTQLEPIFDGYTATVQGSRPYQVVVSTKHFDHGDCECYVGQQNMLCKHMVAVAMAVVLNGKSVDDIDTLQITEPVSSGSKGELSAGELNALKQDVTQALRLIKYYSGPSRIWFSYQNSLEEGCNRLSAIFSRLPVSRQTCKIVVGALIRLDKKLCNGVDDSNGTVGGFIQQCVVMLQAYSALDPGCIDEFYRLTRIQSCFDWEVPLVEEINKRNLAGAIRGKFQK